MAPSDASNHFVALDESSTPNDLDDGSRQWDATRRIEMYLSMLSAYVADVALLRLSLVDEGLIHDNGIESPSPSSSEEPGVTDDNAETNTNVQSVSDHGSTNQSEVSSLNHNIESGSLENPNNKYMHIIPSPTYYLLPSLGPSYGVVNDTASDEDCKS